MTERELFFENLRRMREKAVCELCKRKIRNPFAVWHIDGKTVCCDCVYNLIVSKNYEQFKEKIKKYSE